MSRILVIDDEQDMAEVVQLVLELDNHEVKVELDPTRAVQAVKSFAPHLVLLDLVMPVMDGYEVYRALSELPEMAKVPVAFLTSRNKQIDLMVGLHVLHANEYITKPFDRQDLLARVRRLLSLAG
jgi:two-component system response regulator VicR